MKINRATPKAIRYACKNFHYSKSVPCSQYSYNVFNDKDEWCGVIIYSPGANNNIAKPFNLGQGEVIELVRVALNGKQDVTSKALAISLKQLKKDNPIVKIVVSYADMEQEHTGTLYQATNWIYLGAYNVNSTGGYFLIHGKKIHSRIVHSKGWKQQLKWLKENIDSNADNYITKGKHKYIYCFDKKLKEKYLKISKEYPKNNMRI